MQIIQQVIAIVTGVIKEPIVFKFHLNLNNHILSTGSMMEIPSDYHLGSSF